MEGDGKVNIPRHGLVRKKEFDLVDQTENSVTFAIEDDENTYQNYPYHFRLEITYIVTGKTVRTQYKIFNKETNKVMPYFIGGHQDLIVLYWMTKLMKITILSLRKKRLALFHDLSQKQEC